MTPSGDIVRMPLWDLMVGGAIHVDPGGFVGAKDHGALKIQFENGQRLLLQVA